MNARVVAKVLSHNKAERFAIEHDLRSAWIDLEDETPGLRLEIVPVRDAPEILKYTPILTFASLVINEKLVRARRCPKRGEVAAWLREAIKEIRSSEGDVIRNSVL
jgi:hypothetical protein